MGPLLQHPLRVVPRHLRSGRGQVEAVGLIWFRLLPPGVPRPRGDPCIRGRPLASIGRSLGNSEGQLARVPPDERAACTTLAYLCSSRFRYTCVQPTSGQMESVIDSFQLSPTWRPANRADRGRVGVLGMSQSGEALRRVNRSALEIAWHALSALRRQPGSGGRLVSRRYRKASFL